MLAPDNRTVMISGANRGIGLAIAKTLSEAGYRLSLGARKPDSIDTSQLCGQVMCHHYDATDLQSATLWQAATLEQFGAIDAVVLNAGVIKSVGIETGTEADLDLMWETNFKGPLRLIRATMPSLRKCGHGRVINLASLSGKRLLSESCLLYTSPSPRDQRGSRMPSSA